MNLAHESLRVVNHIGRKDTISRVLDEFYWPGVCREVTQFWKSCANCQRTNQNIKGRKYPLLHCTPEKHVLKGGRNMPYKTD